MPNGGNNRYVHTSHTKTQVPRWFLCCDCVGVYVVHAVYECVSVLAGLSLCLFKGNQCNLRKAVVWNPVMECGREKDQD